MDWQRGLSVKYRELQHQGKSDGIRKEGANAALLKKKGKVGLSTPTD